MLRGFFGALPDLHATEQDMVAAGDTVAVRYVVEATHEGNLLGIAPTGRRVRWDALDIYRLADGMIVEEWAGDDLAAILSGRRVHAAVALGKSSGNDPGAASIAGMGLCSGTSLTAVPERRRTCLRPRAPDPSRSRRTGETHTSSTWIVWLQMMSSNVQSPQ